MRMSSMRAIGYTLHSTRRSLLPSTLSDGCGVVSRRRLPAVVLCYRRVVYHTHVIR